MKNKWVASASMLALACGGSAAFAQDQTPPRQAVEGTQPNTAAPQAGLQEIVVTAQRRSENLQKVPVAVTALSSAALDNARIVNVASLSGYAPNLTVTNQGLASIPTLQLRGITSGVSNNSVDPKIGIYLDGVYIGRSVGAVFDLADLERVEVLRGPQGTLFGRNSTGGALSLVSALPSGKLGIRQQLSYGNDNAFRSRTIIDLPQFGPVKLKFSYLHDQIDGDVKNRIGGRTIDFSQVANGPFPADFQPVTIAAFQRLADKFGTLKYAKRLGARNTDAFQAAMRIEASDDFTIDYRFDYSDQRASGRSTQTLGTTGDATGALAGGIIALQPSFGGTANLSLKPLDVVSNATSEEHVVTQGHNLTLTWRVSDVLTAKNIFGYRKFRQDPQIYDLGSTGGYRFTSGQLGALLAGNIAGVFNPANAPTAGDQFFTLLTARETKQQQISDEQQFIFNWDRFDLTSGVFVFHERSPASDYLGIFLPTGRDATNGNNTIVRRYDPVVVNGVTVFNGFDRTFGNGVTDTIAVNDSIAGYAQLTFHATDKLDLTFGGRYTIDDRSTKINSVAGAAGTGAIVGSTSKVSYERFNYTGIVSYKFSNQTFGYAKIATGYVAGGLLSAIPYKPESLTSYEAGLKTTLFNNRLRANIAGFYSDYKDLQVQTFTGGVQRFDNAGSARIWGVEGEFQAAPMAGLNLVANVGYVNFKYKEYISGGVNVAGFVRPIYTPKWNVRLGGQYDFYRLSNDASLYVNVDARYRSRTPYTAFPSGNPVTDRLAYQKKYILTDVRAGIAQLPIAGTQIGLSGYAKNIFNVRRSTFSPTVINQTLIFDRGRTYGIELSAKF